MEQQYPIMADGRHVGKVCVTHCGLYYHFYCRCFLNNDEIHRLVVTCGTVCENLGILVPVNDGFGLETRLPVKRIGKGSLSFKLIPKREKIGGSFVPIRADEPFAYIAGLKQSFLVLRDGQAGIEITKQQEL